MTLLTLFRSGSAVIIPPPVVTPPNPGPPTGVPLLSIVREVCGVVGIQKPDSVFRGINSNRTMQEMLDLANEMAQRIAYDNRGWTIFRKVQTYYGNGVDKQFWLPADYKRLLLTSNVWSSANTLTPLQFISDPDEWLQRRASGRVYGWGEWTMLGGQMHIEPAIAVGSTVRFAYLEKNCIVTKDGALTDTFTADSDMYRLHPRLLKLGMIWQWKANKGSPYAEDMGTWGDAIAHEFGSDSPAPIIIGALPISSYARVAYPWPVPTP